MNWFKNLNIMWKVMLPILLGFVAILGVVFVFTLPTIERSLYAEKNHFIKNIVESSISMAETYERQYKENLITRDEAFAKIEELTHNTRFEGDNYLFVIDDSQLIYHGVNRTLEGRTLDLFKDVNGKLFLEEAAAELKNTKAAFIEYYWTKPNVDGNFRKISYAQKLQEFEIILFAGIYVDDVENQIAALRMEIVVVFLAIIFILLIVTWLVVKYTIVKPMNLIANIAVDVSSGNLNIKERYESKDEIGNVFNSINEMVIILNKLLQETNALTESASDGKLDVRGRHNEFKGSYAELVKGINSTLDAIIAPLNVAAEYIDRISKGDLPPRINDNYRGDFNEIKNNINQCIDSISYLVDDTNALIKSAIDGKLNYRADIQKHNGDFRKIISGVNDTLDRLVGLIDNMPMPVQIVDKDYKILYINKAGENISEN